MISWHIIRGYSRFLALQTMSCEGSEGSEGPALLTARTRNWYFSPLVRPFIEKNFLGPSDWPT